jgi:hypothetical protein
VVETTSPGSPAADPATPKADAVVTEVAAVRDATDIISRAAEDEAAAAAARARYRSEPMTGLVPDPAVVALLMPDEQLLAIRLSATLERRQPTPGTPLTRGLAGRLLVTSRRLLLVGRRIVAFDLADVSETALSGGHLLLVLRDGTGVTLDVAQPRLLRVEIAAARRTLGSHGRDHLRSR